MRYLIACNYRADGNPTYLWWIPEDDIFQVVNNRTYMCSWLSRDSAYRYYQDALSQVRPFPA